MPGWSLAVPGRLLRCGRRFLRRALDELEDGALAVVSEAVLRELQDAAVAALARLEPRAEDAEELRRRALAAHLCEHASAVRHARVLAERDELLDERLDVLRL